MIPKIIHYCWLSGDPFPEDIKKCIQSWKEILPDYEFWLWDTNRFDIESTPWTKQAFETKKYAFAADYIRLYALYNYGGIYLDSDILVYKSFNNLLNLPYFIGEDYTHSFEPAVIGAEPMNRWIKECLDSYNNQNFILANNQFNMVPLPIKFKNILQKKYEFISINKIDKNIYNLNTNLIPVFNWRFFNSRDQIGIVQTNDSYCSHCYLGSWMKKNTPFYKKLTMNYLPKNILRLIFKITTFLHSHKIKGRINYKNI